MNFQNVYERVLDQTSSEPHVFCDDGPQLQDFVNVQGLTDTVKKDALRAVKQLFCIMWNSWKESGSSNCFLNFLCNIQPVLKLQQSEHSNVVEVIVLGDLTNALPMRNSKSKTTILEVVLVMLCLDTNVGVIYVYSPASSEPMGE